jgi:hypothetical protein
VRLSWSQFEQALRDTLVHKAEGEAFIKLCKLYGIAQPIQEIPDEGTWAEVLEAVAYGSRGNFDVVFKMVESTLSGLNQELVCIIQETSPGSFCLFRPAGFGSKPPVNRLVRKGGKLFFTGHVLEEDAFSRPIRISLAPKTSYWSAPTSEDVSAAEESITLLPFVVYERNPGRIIARMAEPIYAPVGLPSAVTQFTVLKPSLLKAGDPVRLFNNSDPDLYVEATVASAPSGGYIPGDPVYGIVTLEQPVDVAELVGATFNSVVSVSDERFTVGEECLFEVALFSSDQTDIPASWLQDQLAGYDAVAVQHVLGTTFIQISISEGYVSGDNFYAPGISVGATVYVYNISTKNYVSRTIADIDIQSTTVRLQLNSSVPQVDFPSANTWILIRTPESPQDLPAGCQVLESELVLGNPDGAGPHPFYLYDGGLLPATAKTLSSTLAASVELKFGSVKVPTPPTPDSTGRLPPDLSQGWWRLIDIP